MWEGQYNWFPSGSKDFWVTYSVAPEPNLDKIYDSIEFRSDTYDGNDQIQHFETFTDLSIWNEYQRGDSKLTYKNIGISNLQKKFRVWRALFPRDNEKALNRIRNTWA